MAAQLLVGTTTEGNTSSTASYFTLSRFQASQSKTGATEFRVLSAASGYVKVAVDADSSGEPGSRLGYNDTQQAVVSGWNTLTVSACDIVSGMYYWLAINGSANGCFQRSTSGGTFRYKSGTFSSFTFPDPAGTGFSSASYYASLGVWGEVSSDVTGTGSPSATAATASGSGTETVQGAGVPTVAAATASGSGTETLQGSGAVDTTAATIAAAGQEVSQGTGAPQSTAAEAAATGTETVQGMGAPVSAAATAQGSGVVGEEAVTGEGTVATVAATASAAGTETITATGAASAAAATASGTGEETVTGTGETDTASAMASGAGTETVQSTSAPSAMAATVNGSGIVETVDVVGTGAASTTAATASGSGTAGIVDAPEAGDYTTSQGDTWDLIAYIQYGDEMQMHWLIEANPQHREVVLFPAGIRLIVPKLGETGRAPVAPWVTNAGLAMSGSSEPAPSATRRPYTTIQGDTWDGIAYLEYGDEMQMHWLIEANPQHRDTVIFPAGVVLAVPDLGETGRAPTPAWVANG